jgi:hypothetical protein
MTWDGDRWVTDRAPGSTASSRSALRRIGRRRLGGRTLGGLIVIALSVPLVLAAAGGHPGSNPASPGQLAIQLPGPSATLASSPPSGVASPGASSSESGSEPSPAAVSTLPPASHGPLTAGSKPTPTPTPHHAKPPPKLLFGLGTEMSGASSSALVRAAPVHLLSSWFNGTSDLAFMAGWARSLIPHEYAAGETLHLIVYAGSATTTTTQTRYGPACGRAYPLSAQFQADMLSLAKIWAGRASGPRLYVTLFTEFQTYACHASAWLPDNAYWMALKDAYREALATFHAHAPNARVSLGWGGWQDRFDDPATGGGRSMFAHFADVLAISDFQSFQAMQDDTNIPDVLDMTRTLGAYGPVMLAHYKPDNGSSSTFNADTAAMLTDSYLARLVSAGLFAWSFMDDSNVSASSSTFSRIASAIRRYGR